MSHCTRSKWKKRKKEKKEEVKLDSHSPQCLEETCSCQCQLQVLTTLSGDFAELLPFQHLQCAALQIHNSKLLQSADVFPHIYIQPHSYTPATPTQGGICWIPESPITSNPTVHPLAPQPKALSVEYLNHPLNPTPQFTPWHPNPRCYLFNNWITH